MNFNPIVLSIPIFFLLIGIELLYSWYKNKDLYRLGDAYANIGCGIFEQTTGLFVKVFSIGLYVLVYQHFKIWEIPINGWTIFLLFLGVDFTYYWAHRMSHEINLFWVGHVVHHQSEDYNLSVALRQGALQKIFTAPFALPLAIIGFSPEWFLYISAFNTLYQFWIHTEAIGKLGWLEYIFNTPSHHRVHHGRDPKYIDKNHAGSLIIWDRMFGTFQVEEEHPHYGITKPTGTYNPVLAHWVPIADLAKDVQKVRGINKLKLLFNKPGWYPPENGGVQRPPKIDATSYQKFNFAVDANRAKYLMAQFVIVLGYTAFFLFGYAQFTVGLKVFGASLILISLLILGLGFENKDFFFWPEIIRLVLFFVFVFAIQKPVFLIVAGAWLFVSIIFLIRIFLMNKKQTVGV